MPENLESPIPVDEDGEYAHDAEDDATTADDLPEPSDPATIPPDQGDANAALKEAGQ